MRQPDPIVVQLRRRREQLGLSQSYLARLMHTQTTMVSEREIGIHSPQLWSLRRWAEALGMELTLICLDPPVDEIAIERVEFGDWVPLTKAERWAAVRKLSRDGYTTAQIADRLAITTRTVQRYRIRGEPDGQRS